MSEFATAAGHWYKLNGDPCYTVIGKNGKERNATLRDARELQLVPSVTTIIRCAAAPALEAWKRNQLLLAALTLPRREDEPEADWLVRVDRDSRETGRKAADKGTQIHGAIERHFRGEYYPVEFADHVIVARDVILDKCGGPQWFPERSFAHIMGYGGKCDLHSEDWVIDIKTKDGDAAGAKVYDEHIMQLAAYRRGLGVPGAQCGVLFVGRDVASATLVDISDLELDNGLAMFDALLAYFYAKNGLRRA